MSTDKYICPNCEETTGEKSTSESGSRLLMRLRLRSRLRFRCMDHGSRRTVAMGFAYVVFPYGRMRAVPLLVLALGVGDRCRCITRTAYRHLYIQSASAHGDEALTRRFRDSVVASAACRRYDWRAYIHPDVHVLYCCRFPLSPSPLLRFAVPQCRNVMALTPPPPRPQVRPS